MSALGLVHTLIGVAAILFGAVIVFTKKGDRRHRWLGRGYCCSMVLLNVIHRLFVGMGPFHWLALISLATLIAGFIPVYLRKPKGGWLRMHAHFMAWSYVGLLAATAAEIVSRVPGIDFGWSVFLSSCVVVLIGAFVVPISVAKALKP